MQREKIKMIPGVPLTVLLDDAIGRPMSSRFHDGVEYLYNVEHRGAGCLLYLPVEGHQALRRLEVAAGDEIQILKTQTQGQAPQFSARRVSDAELVVPRVSGEQQIAAAAAGLPFMASLQAQIAAAARAGVPPQGVRMLAPQTQALAAPPPLNEHFPERRPMPTPAVTTQVSGSVASGTAVLLAQCLHCAIDAAIGAETFAKAKGKELSFNEEDIRAMALSIYIAKTKSQQQQGGRY